ncbi:hypothetical protein BKA61DRAFT_583280 [Leptodontidium sp. MPI-SDFR-AT-0119]|nr:hypothetical protein BKA61DRAFT_583280 [Leptodontidium sp. MPI-SDFR-AT-0119]
MSQPQQSLVGTLELKPEKYSIKSLVKNDVPKHVLLMPRDTSINEIADLATKDLPLLYRFRDQAKIEIGHWSFSTGNAYHPRHWKVQFSNMFITLDKVIEEVEQTGRMVVDFDAYWHDWKTKPIRCPVCPGPQPQWEGDINALWEPTYPVLLTTRKCAPSIGLDNELDHLKGDFPSLDIHRYFSHEWASIPKYILDKTTIYFQTTELPPDSVRVPRLGWIQLFSSDTDQLTISPYNHYPNLRVTCSKGAGSVAIAEWAVMCTLLLTRNILTALHQQASHQWQPAPLMGLCTLSQLSIGIFGYGHVGQQTAERFLALGAKKVTAVNRHGFTRSLVMPSPRLNDVTVRRVESRDALHEFLRVIDVLILILTRYEFS